MKTASRPLQVESAHGVRLQLEDGRELIDGISSWWAAIHGYNHPVLNHAILDQNTDVAHVMLGGLTHRPAQALATKLVEITPAPLRHVFFSDSGSVGVEVALKMALQYHKNEGQAGKTEFIALNSAYHGDTFLAMGMGEDSDFQASFDQVLRKPFRVRPAYRPDEIEQCLSQLQTLLKKEAHRIAAMIVEPIMQGAGGFRFFESEYLEKATQLCHQHNVLMIFDEVATGFGRTGKLFAAEHVATSPDIMVLGKALTAGYMGHAATLATDNVFGAFWDDDPEKAFMHGPTFMGNPLACAVALAGIELFESENYLDKILHINAILNDEFEGFSHEKIEAIRIQGAIAAIEVKNASDLKGFGDYAVENGTWLRSFETYLYTAPAYVIEEADLRKLCQVMKGWFNN